MADHAFAAGHDKHDAAISTFWCSATLLSLMYLLTCISHDSKSWSLSIPVNLSDTGILNVLAWGLL